MASKSDDCAACERFRQQYGPRARCSKCCPHLYHHGAGLPCIVRRVRTAPRPQDQPALAVSYGGTA